MSSCCSDVIHCVVLQTVLPLLYLQHFSWIRQWRWLTSERLYAFLLVFYNLISIKKSAYMYNKSVVILKKNCLPREVKDWYCLNHESMSTILVFEEEVYMALMSLAMNFSWFNNNNCICHGMVIELTSFFSFLPPGKGCVFSFDLVGSYERETYRAGGSASALLQPLLDNQVYIHAVQG